MQRPQFELGQITTGHLVDTVAEQFSDSKALEYHSPRIAFTYDEFRAICNRVAKGLMALGIERGDHIAIWANNVPQWVLTQFGSGKTGRIKDMIIRGGENIYPREIEEFLYTNEKIKTA